MKFGTVFRRALLPLVVAAMLLTLPARTAVEGWSANQRLFGNIGHSLQSDPAIALGGAGGNTALVAWTDERNSVPDIYANASGSPLVVNNARVSDLDANSPGADSSSSVAMDASGVSYVIYTDQSDVILARREVGGAVVSTTVVSGDPQAWNEDSRFPRIAGNGSSDLVVIWQVWHDEQWDIFSARCDGASVTCAAPVQVDDNGAPPTSRSQTRPRIARNGNTVVAVWEDNRESGAQFPHVYSSQSTDGGASWGASVRVDGVFTSSTSAIKPSVGMDTGGNVFAVWEQHMGGPTSPADIFAAQWNGATWTNRVRVDAAPAGVRAFNPDVALGSGGRFIVWEDYRAGNINPDIFSARWNGSAWVEAAVLNQPAQQVKPAVVVNGNNARVAWQDNRSGHWDIFSASWNGASWDAGAQVSENTARTSFQQMPSLSPVGNGDFMLVWLDNRSYADDLYASRFDHVSQTWGAAMKLPTAAEDGDVQRGETNLATAVDSAGKLHALWAEYRGDSDGVRIFHAVLSGTIWSPAAQVSDNLTHTAWSPHMQPALDSRDGRVAAAWVTTQVADDYSWPPTYTVFASWWVSATSTWMTPTQVNTAPLRGDPNPSVAIDSAGNTFVAWTEASYSGGMRANIRIAKSPAGGGAWTQYRTVNSPLSNAAWCMQQQAQLKIDASDRLHVVWSGCKPWQLSVYYSRSIDGGSTWISPSLPIAPISETESYPALAVSGGVNPELNVVYASEPNGNAQFFSVRNVTGTWQTSLPVSDGPTQWDSARDGRPGLAFDANSQRFLAVFADHRSGLPQMYGAWMGATGGVPCSDAFEPDNSFAQAKPIVVGAPQTHAFCDDDVEDWVMFTAEAGTRYAMQTAVNSGSISPTLELYAADGATLLDAGVSISRTLGSGTHFVRVSNAVVASVGYYDVSVNVARLPARVMLPVVMRATVSDW